MDQIQRNGEWWHRQPTGGWLKYDAGSGQWVPAAGSPPPPPPPPAGAGGPYVPLEKAAGRGMSWDGLRGSLQGLDRRIALVGGAVLLAVLLVAGGFVAFGGNEPGVDLAAAAVPLPEPKKLSKKQQFIHDADTVCAHLMTVAGKMETPADLAGLVDVLRKARGEIFAAYDQLKALKPPAPAKVEWRRYLGDRDQLRIFDQMIAAAERGDVATLQSLNAQLQSKSGRGDRWAKRYGFKVCSQDF